MSLYHIDGLSGTGKSSVCKELQLRGYNAIDADNAFGYFADPTTNSPTAHSWLWDQQKLHDFVTSVGSRAAFICGGAMNQGEFMGWFTKRFTLYVDDQTLMSRLLTRTNSDFWQRPENLAQQLEWNQSTPQRAKVHGTILIDATQPLHQVVEQILAYTGV